MEYKYAKDGGIGAYKENGTRAFVQTYAHNEVSIKFIDSEEESHIEFIRVRIGTNEGEQIVMLENGKFYMIKGFAQSICSKDELSPKYAVDANNKITKLNSYVEDFSRKVTLNRTLVGYIKYLSDGVKPINPNDLDICYNDEHKRFEYYTATTDEWLSLPKTWQHAHKLVRLREYLPKECDNGTVYGIIDEDVLVEYLDGKWLPISFPAASIGDEYLVQEVYNKNYNGNASASVIYTIKGWTYLPHYNYL